MISILLLTLWHAETARAPALPDVPDVVQLTIAPRLDKRGRWCSGPVFEATIRYSGSKSVWLDLGKPTDPLPIFGYSLGWSSDEGLGGEGLASGRSHDWGSIDVLRGPDATVLAPGESVTRTIDLSDVRLRIGSMSVSVSLRIHGTENLDDSTVHTYEAQATVDLVLRRRGGCIAVRAG